MSILGAAALVSGGLNAVKGLTGAIQGFGARKKIKDQWANRPTYTRPQEVDEMMNLYRKAANRTQLPGQDLIEAKLGRVTGRSIWQAERFAPSSTAALGAITDIYGKEQDAVRDLGIQFANYKAAQEGRLAAGLGQAAQYSDQEFMYNKAQPWDIRMNELQSNKQAGFENMWGGITGAASALGDYAGTKYYTDTMANLYGNNPSGGGLTKDTKYGTFTFNG